MNNTSSSDRKLCPYCGEEIMAAAKKCRYCGEWLYENKQQAIHPNTNIGIQTDQSASYINKTVIYSVMVIVALVATFNLIFEGSHLDYAYSIPETISYVVFLIFIILAIAFSIVNIQKRKIISDSLRLWTAIEVLSLCAPIEMIIQINHIGYLGYEYIGLTLFLTTVTGLLFYHVSKNLSIKKLYGIYIFGSIAFVILSVVSFLTFKNM
ncbi:MAG: zinc ribbon domain-containing protein [Muribaculum sp.]|nr:zinc ribbon domain-containing protein [Muribaculum sp.]